MGLFKHYLTSVYRRSKINLKLSFETQSFKPKNKKSYENCWDCLESAFFIFLPLEVINGVESPYKKNYSQEN